LRDKIAFDWRRRQLRRVNARYFKPYEGTRNLQMVFFIPQIGALARDSGLDQRCRSASIYAFAKILLHAVAN